MHRRPTVTALLTLAVGIAALSGCAPSGPSAEVGDVIVLSEADYLEVLDDAAPTQLLILVPESTWTVQGLVVVDDVPVPDGRLAVPEGAAIVVVGGVVGYMGGSNETTFAVVTGDERVVIDPEVRTAVVVPDGGASSTFVATYDGRDLAYDLSTGGVADGTEPYQGATNLARFEDWAVTGTGFPADVALNTVVPLPLNLRVTMSTWAPDVGWAPAGSAWLTLESAGEATTGLDVDGWPDGAGSAELELDEVRVSIAGETYSAVPAAEDPLTVVDVIEVPFDGDTEPVEIGAVVQVTAVGDTDVAPDGEDPLDPFSAEIEGEATIVLDWTA